jgi:hypothetical protein
VIAARLLTRVIATTPARQKRRGCAGLRDFTKPALAPADSPAMSYTGMSRWYGSHVSVVRGRVRNGQVALETELPEGADVVVLTASEGFFEVPEDEVAELEARIAEPDRGELDSARDVIDRLRSPKR